MKRIIKNRGTSRGMLNIVALCLLCLAITNTSCSKEDTIEQKPQKEDVFAIRFGLQPLQQNGKSRGHTPDRYIPDKHGHLIDRMLIFVYDSYSSWNNLPKIATKIDLTPESTDLNNQPNWNKNGELFLPRIADLTMDDKLNIYIITDYDEYDFTDISSITENDLRHITLVNYNPDHPQKYQSTMSGFRIGIRAADWLSEGFTVPLHFVVARIRMILTLPVDVQNKYPNIVWWSSVSEPYVHNASTECYYLDYEKDVPRSPFPGIFRKSFSEFPVIDYNPSPREEKRWYFEVSLFENSEATDKEDAIYIVVNIPYRDLNSGIQCNNYYKIPIIQPNVYDGCHIKRHHSYEINATINGLGVSGIDITWDDIVGGVGLEDLVIEEI